MLTRFLQEVLMGFKKIPLKIVEVDTTRGFRRIVPAIDPKILEKTVDLSEKAISGSTMLTDPLKEQIHQARIVLAQCAL